MIAAHDPLVGIGCARNLYDDVIERFDVPVGLHFEMHFGRSGADLIGLGQGAAPAVGSHLPFERGEQRLRIRVGDGQDRNFGEGLGIFQLEALGVLRGSDSGGERIAGIERHIGHAAALHAVAGTPSAGRENVTLRVAVVRRIGIDQASHGAVFGRHLGLDAAPGISVTRDHDGALD